MICPNRAAFLREAPLSRTSLPLYYDKKGTRLVSVRYGMWLLHFNSGRRLFRISSPTSCLDTPCCYPSSQALMTNAVPPGLCPTRRVFPLADCALDDKQLRQVILL
ncbi:unnamed protein product [Sphacelaria rigidula]